MIQNLNEQKIMRYERKWYIKKISKPELNLILSKSNFFFRAASFKKSKLNLF